MIKSWKTVIIVILSLAGTIMEHISFSFERSGTEAPNFFNIDIVGWAMAGWFLSSLILFAFITEEAIGKEKLCNVCGAIAKSAYWSGLRINYFVQWVLLFLYIPLGIVFWLKVKDKVRCSSCGTKM